MFPVVCTEQNLNNVPLDFVLIKSRPIGSTLVALAGKKYCRLYECLMVGEIAAIN